jgi:hypothetical protein
MRAGSGKNSAPSLLGDLLDSVLGRFGLKNRLKENEVFAVWEEAVGKTVARNCQPKSIADGILVVETKNNVWMQELSMLRQGIMDGINKLMGWDAVRDLRFRIGVIDGAADHKSPQRRKKKSAVPAQKLDPETEREMEKALAGIEDEELKDALRGLMIRGIKRPKR